MEYTVILTKKPNSPWQGVVPALPSCVAEAATREEVIAQIREELIQTQIEMVRIEVPGPARAFETNGLPGKKGAGSLLEFAGIFRDDPTLDEMFDEIERRRDAHLAGE